MRDTETPSLLAVLDGLAYAVVTVGGAVGIVLVAAYAATTVSAPVAYLVLWFLALLALAAVPTAASVGLAAVRRRDVRLLRAIPRTADRREENDCACRPATGETVTGATCGCQQCP